MGSPSRESKCLLLHLLAHVDPHLFCLSYLFILQLSFSSPRCVAFCLSLAVCRCLSMSYLVLSTSSLGGSFSLSLSYLLSKYMYLSRSLSLSLSVYLPACLSIIRALCLSLLNENVQLFESCISLQPPFVDVSKLRFAHESVGRSFHQLALNVSLSLSPSHSAALSIYALYLSITIFVCVLFLSLHSLSLSLTLLLSLSLSPSSS